MKPSTVLRITSLITLIFAAGHSLGGMESWSPVGETEVLKAMKSFRFDAEGVTRTYFDFYLGFGLIVSVYLFLQAILLWQLAALAKTEALRLRPLVVSFFGKRKWGTGNGNGGRCREIRVVDNVQEPQPPKELQLETIVNLE